MATTTLNRVQAGDLTLTYRELGEGPPVLLLHGWPTSSFLWREAMKPIARANRVIALDLPGFGGSDKPTGTAYTFGLFAQAIDAFLDELGIAELAVGGHDLGGPIAIDWALEHPGRVTRLALLNTLVYPPFDPFVMEFVRVLSTPGERERLASAEGLTAAMKLGVADEAKLTDEVIAGVVGPYDGDEEWRALADAGIGLEVERFAEIAGRLGELTMPARLIYGAQDRVVPDAPQTMQRLQRDLPDATITELPDAGHFLQEDAPEEVGALLAEFFAR